MKEYYDFELTEYNSYRIRSYCSKAIFPESNEDFLRIFKEHSLENLVIIGSGHNIILSNCLYDKTFIIINKCFDSFEINGTRINASAGIGMQELSTLVQPLGLSGIEVFFDIPSSLGGAVVMNAGASGEEIKDVLDEVTYINPTDNVINTIKAKDINYRYRNSLFQENGKLIVLSATLILRQDDKFHVKRKMDTIKEARWAKQPRDFPNAGSVFKRPPGKFVGPMVESLGLKGFGYGGAKVSEKHAGFIINYNNATGSDIIKTIEYVKERVFKEFNVELEVEQRIL